MKSEMKKYPLQQLYEGYCDNGLRVNMEYQRGAIWKRSQQEGLIDSLLRGYEIPVFYFHLTSNRNTFGGTGETRYIIDGQQRLNAIADFVNNKFELPRQSKPGIGSLPTAEALPSWAGKNYDSLSPEDQERFRNRDLYAVEMEATDDEDRELFIRLQAGTALTDQEKRDAWPGEMTKFIIKYAGKEGHPISIISPPHDFFKILKTPKQKKAKKNGEDAIETEYAEMIEHKIDNRAAIRRFFAQLSMTIMYRSLPAPQGRDFIDLKGETIIIFI